MNLSISRKTEKAFAASYLPSALSIDGLTIYEGHEAVAEIAFPNLVVYAEGSAPHPDMPPEVGCRVVRLRCKFTIDSTVNSADDRDTWKQKLESAMTNDISAIQAVLNRPEGADNRLVKGIHFHYVEMSDDPSAVGETDWIDDLVFDVTCELLDS